MASDERRFRRLADDGRRMHPLVAGPLGTLFGGLAGAGCWGWEAALLQRSGAHLDLLHVAEAAAFPALVGGGIGLLCGFTSLAGSAWWLAWGITLWAWLLSAKVAAGVGGTGALAVMAFGCTVGWVVGQLIARAPLPAWAQLGAAAELTMLAALAVPLHVHLLTTSTDGAGIAVTLLVAVVALPVAAVCGALHDVVPVGGVVGLFAVAGGALAGVVVKLGPTIVEPAATPDRPLVVLVSISGLRADRLGGAGYARPVTPSLDALARRSVHYTQAYSPAPWSPPAIASLLTARWPHRHGAGARWDGRPTDTALRTDAVPWPSAFLEAGYATAAFVGDPGLRPYGLDRGFLSWSDTPARGPMPSLWLPARLLGAPFPLRRRAGEVVDDALAWLQAHPEGGRLVWVQLADAGGPFDVGAAELDAVGLTHRPYPADHHDAALKAVDTAVGRLVEALPPDAVLVVVGERGVRGLETRGPDHLWGHHLHPELVHVPLMIRAPSVAAREVDQPVSLVDVGPTLTFLARLPDLPDVDGQRLQRVFGLPEPERLVLAEATRYGPPSRSARRGRFRLVVQGDAERLFDLGEDPLESRAIGQEPTAEGIRRELRGALPPDAAAAAPPSAGEALGRLLTRLVP